MLGSKTPLGLGSGIVDLLPESTVVDYLIGLVDVSMFSVHAGKASNVSLMQPAMCSDCCFWYWFW